MASIYKYLYTIYTYWLIVINISIYSLWSVSLAFTICLVFRTKTDEWKQTSRSAVATPLPLSVCTLFLSLWERTHCADSWAVGKWSSAFCIRVALSRASYSLSRICRQIVNKVWRIRALIRSVTIRVHMYMYVSAARTSENLLADQWKYVFKNSHNFWLWFSIKI